jgi:hypothetical protein
LSHISRSLSTPLLSNTPACHYYHGYCTCALEVMWVVVLAFGRAWSLSRGACFECVCMKHVCCTLCPWSQVRGLLSCEPDSPAALLLKAELETSRQQPRKALKTLGPLLTAAHQHTIRWANGCGSRETHLPTVASSISVVSVVSAMTLSLMQVSASTGQPRKWFSASGGSF